MAPNRTRRPLDAREAAEAAFKAATTKPAEPVTAPKGPPSIPGAKELISLRIDQDVLAHFQDAGPGWQERINTALRKAAGL
ncbi:MAG: BrnA antitoxin family protein [Methylovirgula sp.]